ncbi:MAG: hypothetical protein GOV15_02850 [Candidatus Diapherotrites archaeon]|nr:hypothetical protein [Candidatus Diapherotrites archaeon]
MVKLSEDRQVLEHGFLVFKKDDGLHVVLHKGAIGANGVFHFTEGREISSLKKSPNGFDLERVLADRPVSSITVPAEGDFLPVPLFASDFRSITRLKSSHEVRDFVEGHLHDGVRASVAATAFEKLVLQAGLVETVSVHARGGLDFQQRAARNRRARVERTLVRA